MLALRTLWSSYEKVLRRYPVRTQAVTTGKYLPLNLFCGGCCGDVEAIWPITSPRGRRTLAWISAGILWTVGDTLAQKVVEKQPVLNQKRLLVTGLYATAVVGPAGHWWAGSASALPFSKLRRFGAACIPALRLGFVASASHVLTDRVVSWGHLCCPSSCRTGNT